VVPVSKPSTVSSELVARCKRGDRAAYEELVRATHRRVYSLAYRMVGDRGDAEDVAQEAYLRMFRGLAGFREEAAFETWMHRIVANCAVSHLRRRGRFGDLVRDEEPPERPTPDRAQEITVQRDDLTRGLASLPEGQRVCLLLKDVYDLSVREVAQEVGIEEGAVKVRLHRARKRLKEMLEEEDRRAGEL
jgi:RNA polymerase sigma-70 factor (ECF subfamily)